LRIFESLKPVIGAINGPAAVRSMPERQRWRSRRD
jgi:hypothetical protein